MATFRFEINKKRPTRNKTFIVWLRITTDGKRKLLKTDIELKSANDFNSKARQDNWIRPSEPNSAKWNNDLADILEKTKDTFMINCKIAAICDRLKILRGPAKDATASWFINYCLDICGQNPITENYHYEQFLYYSSKY